MTGFGPPHLAKDALFQRTGHLAHYTESMYPPMEMEGVRYYMKPMNCPFHHKIFDSKPRSYRDLPLRLGEYGTCYRFEKSGELLWSHAGALHADERCPHLLLGGAV